MICPDLHMLENLHLWFFLLKYFPRASSVVSLRMWWLLNPTNWILQVRNSWKRTSGKHCYSCLSWASQIHQKHLLWVHSGRQRWQLERRAKAAPMPREGDAKAESTPVPWRSNCISWFTDWCGDPADHKGGLRFMHDHQHCPQNPHRHGLRSSPCHWCW